MMLERSLGAEVGMVVLEKGWVALMVLRWVPVVSQLGRVDS